MRKYARRTEFRLVMGFLLLVFVVGEGLIYIFYGRYAALLGLLCLLGTLVPAALVWGIFWLLEQVR